MSEQRAAAFADLVARAQACRRCPRMEGRRRVLGPANGPLDARVVFVAEAPGRLGAERTAIPFSGDQSGRNFDLLLAAAGLNRAEVFITNAALCNPRDERGRNAAPTLAEVGNCAAHLQATLELLQPLVVVALGQVALRALAAIAPHDLTLAGDVARPVAWHGRWLVALYHPSPRAQLHRPWGQQVADWRALGAFLNDVESGGRPRPGP